MNPYNLAELPCFQDVEATEEYQLAYQVATRVQELYSFFLERPRFASLCDQLTRNTQSVLLNYSEAFGKGRGFYVSALCIAKGEAYEATAAISLCPEDIRNELKPKMLRVAELLTKRILAAPTK